MRSRSRGTAPILVFLLTTQGWRQDDLRSSRPSSLICPVRQETLSQARWKMRTADTLHCTLTSTHTPWHINLSTHHTECVHASMYTCMCVHACVHTCLCACICVYMPMCACICVYMHVCACMCVHSCVYASVCTCMYVYACVCTHLCIHACVCMCLGIHSYMHASVYTCMCVHVPICMSRLALAVEASVYMSIFSSEGRTSQREGTTAWLVTGDLMYTHDVSSRGRSCLGKHR